LGDSGVIASGGAAPKVGGLLFREARLVFGRIILLFDRGGEEK
jgi:hypothetical protein